MVFKSRSCERLARRSVGKALCLLTLLPLLSSCVSLLPELPTVTLVPEATFGVAPAQLSFRVDILDPFTEERDWRVRWDLGDGTQAEGLSVSHTYAEAGRYPVRVRVDDGETFQTERSLEVLVLAPPRFQLHRYPTGPGPAAVAVVDVNLDFRRDVISANADAHNVSVFLGDGRKLERSRFAYKAIKAPSPAPQPQWLAWGDFNNDRLPDLLLLNPPDDNLSLLFGNGLGGFAPPSGYPLKNPEKALIEDFNGDGNQDLLVLERADGTDRLTLLIGRGTGEFFAAGAILEKPWITDLAAGDLDGDGDLDVVVTTAAFGVELLVLGNDGQGHFETAFTGLYPVKPAVLALGQVDGDDRLDAVTVQRDGSLVVWSGQGDLSLVAGEAQALTLRGAVALVVGDLNDDGALDLIVEHRRTGTEDLALLLGTGRGQFAPAPLENFLGTHFPVMADLNGDGRKDLLAVSPETDEIVFAENLAP